MFEQRPVEKLFPAGAESNTAFVSRVALDSGSLGGRWTHATYDGWEEGSVPKIMFRDERFAETLERVSALKTLCAPYYPTLAEAAIRYALSAKEVATVIVGMSSPAGVNQSIALSDGELFGAELAGQLLAHAWPRNYYQ